MLSLSITFPPDRAERTNLLSQTSLKTLIELSKKCRWPLVISVLDSTKQIEAMFPKLDASQIAGISATKFAFPKQQKEPLENVSHVLHCGRTLHSGEGRHGRGTFSFSAIGVLFPGNGAQALSDVTKKQLIPRKQDVDLALFPLDCVEQTVEVVEIRRRARRSRSRQSP